jgi:hypothetical protein
LKFRETPGFIMASGFWGNVSGPEISKEGGGREGCKWEFGKCD